MVCALFIFVKYVKLIYCNGHGLFKEIINVLYYKVFQEIPRKFAPKNRKMHVFGLVLIPSLAFLVPF